MNETSSQPQTIYSIYRSQLTANLNAHIRSIDPSCLDRVANPISNHQLTTLTHQLPVLPSIANELRRSIISSVFSSLISHHLNHSSSSQSYLLYYLLDLALAFVDDGLAAPELALGCIEEILETSTVEQAEFIFGYLESRVESLTVGMLPDRGKGLIFLRMQNNLLRRLSKSLHTVFCGRILCFLSSVFPIAEKSGVNLRGAFNIGNITKFDQFTASSLASNLDEVPDSSDNLNPTKDPINLEKPKEPDPKPIPPTNPTTEEVKSEERDSARIKALKSAADKREFYTRFWSLQSLLSNPPELFKSWNPEPTPAAVSTDPNLAQPSTANLKKLKDGISKTLEVFGRMTKKELELGSNHQPQKVEDLNGFEQFFFPKFLTKSNLLDLEIADPYFRRQVLTQFLIILQYIRGFSPEDRSKRASLPKSNRISEIPYVYQPRDEAWVLKLSGEVWKTLYATPPHGEIFAMTIQQILIRESSWIMWKAGSCASFEKPSLDLDSSPGYQRITGNLMKYPHPVGTPALSKLWQNKVSVQSLEKIDPNAGMPDLKTLHMKIQRLDQQMEQLQNNIPTDNDAKAESLKLQMAQLQERKAGLSWRALRIAQSTYLQFFGKIGMPADIGKLIALIEEAKNRPNLTANRPISGPNASPSTTPNLQPVAIETSTSMDIDSAKSEPDHALPTSDTNRAHSQETSQPDVVMLDGESILDGEKGESVDGPAPASEFDGELINDGASAVAPAPKNQVDEPESNCPSPRPVSPNRSPPISSSINLSVPTRPPHLNRQHSQQSHPPTSQLPQHVTQVPLSQPQPQYDSMAKPSSQESSNHKLSEIEQVIRRMEAEADRSVVGTPTPPPVPTSSGGNGRHSAIVGDYSRNHHISNLHYYHPPLPNPHHHHSHRLTRQSSSNSNNNLSGGNNSVSPNLVPHSSPQVGIGQKRHVNEIVDVDGDHGIVSANDIKKLKN